MIIKSPKNILPQLLFESGIEVPEKSILEIKDSNDFIGDGVLSYGVRIGRFEFLSQTIYAISNIIHARTDCNLYWLLSKAEYEDLKLLSKTKLTEFESIPKGINEFLYDKYFNNKFLCGETIYCERATFSLNDV